LKKINKSLNTAKGSLNYLTHDKIDPLTYSRWRVNRKSPELDINDLSEA